VNFGDVEEYRCKERDKREIRRICSFEISRTKEKINVID
jgi:hypothetical protein